jgi:hypothetical protein
LAKSRGALKMSAPESDGIHQVNWVQHLLPTVSPLGLYEAASRLVERDGFKHSPNLTTLGLPMYLAEHLFGNEAFSRYFHANLQLNEFLYSSFTSLYKAFHCALSEFFNMPLYFHPQLAIPGFHLFRSGPTFPYSGGGWHVDRFSTRHLVPQHSSWSATLILGFPTVPHLIDFETSDGSGQAAYSRAHRPGFITLFRSDRSHRVGAMPSNAASDRISLQAHIAILNGNAIAFW